MTLYILYFQKFIIIIIYTFSMYGIEIKNLKLKKKKNCLNHIMIN